ncbi:MAG: hypothetical protein P9E24_02010 [Candidatus Competibacter sp.]|nr:hypothetical protein [Candidatus Competibacter sp.]MDG4583546.1 hypothetical protein [Candidatus Competibacter sp.]
MTTHPNALIASDYVICVTLRAVPDIFNVEWLWDRVRSGQEGVLLLEALKRHPRRIARSSGQRQETYYSHVVIRISERDFVRDERLEDGFGRRLLLRELRRLHEQELGDHLAENATIRYRLEPDPALRPGEVQALFGRAIYLPADDETPAFRIEVTADGQSDWREVGSIYPGQRLTLLNGDRRASSFAVVAWPFPGSESILLLRQSGAPTQVSVMEEPPACLNLTGDGQGGFVARDHRGRGLRLRVVALAADVEPSPLPEQAPLESLTRPEPRHVAPVADVDKSAAGSEPSAPADGDYTIIDHWGRREPVFGIPIHFEQPSASPPAVLESAPPPSAAPTPPAEGDQRTWIPRRPAACLQVAGVALQRLSTYAAAGISDWRISFNRAGGLVLDNHPDAAAWLRIDSADRLFGEVVGLSAPLELPGVWQPFPELELEFFAAPSSMTTHYLGWVRLPAPLALPVPRERAVSFGRGSEADIAPRLLADPRSLRWEGKPNKTVGISAEYLGLSRRHLRVQVRREDWWVQLESRNMSVYRLAPSGEVLDVLSPGMDTAAAAKPGDLLVAGGYVLALGAVE